MNKQALLEETYNSAFNDELEKVAKSYADEGWVKVHGKDVRRIAKEWKNIPKNKRSSQKRDKAYTT